MNRGCEVCLVREFASDEAKDALILWQARQIHRLTGGVELVPPDFSQEPASGPVVSPPARSVLSVVEAALFDDGVFRKPPRVAAPRLIDRLAEAGLFLTSMEEAS